MKKCVLKISKANACDNTMILGKCENLKLYSGRYNGKFFTRHLSCKINSHSNKLVSRNEQHFKIGKIINPICKIN